MADAIEQSQALAAAAAQALNRANEIKRSKKSLVWNANAVGVDPRPFIEARSKMHKDQNTVFEHAENLVSNPEPGFHYGWAKLGAPITVMRAGCGQYKYVKPAEVKSEMRAMFTTHKGVSGELVCNGSLVLVGIPEKAWLECYIEPEIESIARMAQEQARVEDEVYEGSAGSAKVIFDVQQERE